MSIIQTFADHTGDNSTTSFAFTFPYLDDSHVVVQVDQASVAGGAFDTKLLTTDYTIQTSPTSAIIFNSAPATGDRIRIKRDSASNTALVDFENGSVLTEVELDRAYLHNLYLNEEIEEGSGKNVMTKNSAGNFEADLAKIVDLADPTLAQDAATKNYVDTQDALQVTKTGDSMTGELAMGSNKITGLATPTATTDAVNKSYADGLSFSGASEDYVNQQISNQITGSSTASSKYTFAGNGSTTAFTFSPGIDLNGDTMYEVAIDGVMQEPTVAYAIDSTANTITFTSAPPNTSNIVVIQRGYSVPVSAGLTLSSIENIANNTLLGNDSGSSAAPQALTSTEVRTVLNVADGSTANDTDANLKNRANHTGTQAASTISDFDTEVANNSAVAANTAKVSNATHTGDVTGATALTIADDAITTAKIADGVEIKSTNIALYNSSSSTEGGQLLLNEPGVNSPVFSEVQSFSVDTFKDTTNISGHGTNSKMLRIFQGSVSTSPTAFADNGNVSFSGSLFPTTTANDDLGTSSLKWQDVYSSTGAFNGSDLNLKQDIEELSEAENRVAVTAKGLLKKYRLKKAVEEKGSNARYHFGIIAQELQAAFQAEGLDPMRYGIIAENTWWEKTVDGKRSVSNDAQEGYSEVTEMSVRYTELLAFIISAL